NEYGGSPAFAGRPTTAQGREGNDVTAAPKPIWQRRPVRFYVDPGVPEVITKPWRRNFLNLALPVAEGRDGPMLLRFPVYRIFTQASFWQRVTHRIH
ncbi:MAG: hypothetical protein ACXVA4_12335, partial [Ktedonobacterales bacterium]